MKCKIALLLRLLPILLFLTLLSSAASAQCTYTFAFAPPGPINLDPVGGSGSILLNTQAGCAWTASTATPWVTLITTSGTGTSQVALTYQANNTGILRNGTVIIAGTTINLTQASAISCTFSFAFTPPGPISLDPAGGGGSVLLNTQSGCVWTASTTTPWITVTTPTGTGTAQVALTYQANNTGVARTGSVIIAGTTINLTQASAVTCGFTFTFAPPGPITVDPAGGTGSILLTTQTTCAWTASTSTPWITITTPSGNGTTQVALSYLPNNTGVSRTGSVIVAGTLINITQAPIVNTNPTVSPALVSFVYRIGDAIPAAQSLAISGLGTGGTARTFTVDAPTVSWLTVSPSGGSAPAPSGAAVAVSLVPGTLPAGNYTTTITVRFPADNAAVVAVPVSLTVQPASSVPVSNTNKVISHIADSQGWQTTVILINIDTVPAPYSLRFYGSQTTGRSSGTPMEMAFVAIAGRTSLLEGTIPVGGSRIIQTAGTDPFLNIGWVEMITSKNIAGSGVFRDNNFRQEAAVALTSGVRAFVLPFDNTLGQVTSYALVNTNATETITVNAIVRDENGITLATLPIALQGRGHVATETNTQFPASANQRGTIEFRTANPDITGLGFRFAAITPGVNSRPFTSFPIQTLP